MWRSCYRFLRQKGICRRLHQGFCLCTHRRPWRSCTGLCSTQRRQPAHVPDTQASGPRPTQSRSCGRDTSYGRGGTHVSTAGTHVPAVGPHVPTVGTRFLRSARPFFSGGRSILDIVPGPRPEAPRALSIKHHRGGKKRERRTHHC